MSNIIMLKNVRLSFPNIINPRTEYQGQPCAPSFSATFLLEEGGAQYKEFMKSILEIAKTTWKDKTEQIMKVQITPNSKNRCYGPGIEKINPKTMDVRDGYAGHIYLSTSCYLEKDDLQIINSQGKGFFSKRDGENYKQEAQKLYGGCYVNVALNSYIPKDKFLIRCALKAIQFHSDGEPFGEPRKLDFSDMFESDKTDLEDMFK